MQKVIILTGPTASGKSDLAVQYGINSGNVVIINADSMQVYKEIPIIAASPKKYDLEKVPHKLYEILTGNEQLSAGKWLELVENEIKIAHNNAKIPLIVGGTTMYIRLLIDGISQIPDIPEEINIEAKNELSNLGKDDFFAKLVQFDSKCGEKIKKTDSQRMLRAFSVMKYTGKSIFDYHNNNKPSILQNYDVKKIVLMPPREVVYKYCNSRFCDMIQDGVIDEIKALIDMKYRENSPVYNAIGVLEIIDYINEKINYENMVEKVQQYTRNYAKRQMTWLRNKFLDFQFIDEKNLGKFLQKIN